MKIFLHDALVSCCFSQLNMKTCSESCCLIEPITIGKYHFWNGTELQFPNFVLVTEASSCFFTFWCSCFLTCRPWLFPSFPSRCNELRVCACVCARAYRACMWSLLWASCNPPPQAHPFLILFDQFILASSYNKQSRPILLLWILSLAQSNPGIKPPHRPPH